jgi:hypothetical protein
MKIQFDSNIVNKFKLKTAEQLLFFVLLLCSNGKLIPKYLLDLISTETITKLRDGGLVAMEINQTGINMNIPYDIRMGQFENIDKQFEVFDSLYPLNAERQDGSNSYLKSASKLCKALYRKAAGENGENCEAINNAIRKEVLFRKSNGSLNYIKTMLNWLRAEPWNDPEQTEGNDIKISSYGQTVI